MKTLLITGVYKYESDYNGYFTGVKYDIDLFGQSNEDHKLIYIKSFCVTLSGYTALMDLMTREYCKYYDTNDFNIIHLDMMKNISTLKNF